MMGRAARVAGWSFNAEIVARTAWQAFRTPSRETAVGPVHLFLTVADHFEPGVGGAPVRKRAARLDTWRRAFPEIARRFRDADGCTPRHTFFYPWDEYLTLECAGLAELCAESGSEVELHLHHGNDTEVSLRQLLRAGLSAFRSHGCLSSWSDGRSAFGFVHGNWALDNSRPGEGRCFCGVNNELDVLRGEGCYADFTFPAWKKRAQPRYTNTLLRAPDEPHRAKSYDRGRRVQAGDSSQHLLLVQGPLVPFLDRSRGRLRIAMDDGDLAASRRYSPDRLDRWVSAGIHVAGRPDCRFIKLHTHGAADGNREALLETDLAALYADILTRYNDGQRFVTHFTSAREMYNVIRYLEAGEPGMPAAARNWILPPPPTARA